MGGAGGWWVWTATPRRRRRRRRWTETTTDTHPSPKQPTYTPTPNYSTYQQNYSTEPLFAAATAAAFLGERLKPTGMLGGVAILAACLVTQVDASALASVLPLLGKVSDEVSERVE